MNEKYRDGKDPVGRICAYIFGFVLWFGTAFMFGQSESSNRDLVEILFFGSLVNLGLLLLCFLVCRAFSHIGL